MKLLKLKLPKLKLYDMKRHITLSTLALLLFSASFAQISLEDSEFSVKANPDDFATDAKTYLHNNAIDAEDTVIKWQVLELSADNSEWESSVCTGELCIGNPDLSKEYTFDLPLGEKMEIKLGFTNDFNSGSGEMTVMFWSVKNPTYRDTVSYNMSTWSATVKDPEQKGFNAYPNPAKNFITVVLTKSSRETINIYNILGNKVKTADVYNGGRINISSLPKGVYILRAAGDTSFSKTIQKL